MIRPSRGVGFARSFFPGPDAYEVPEGGAAAFAFHWLTPPIETPGDFAVRDFALRCDARDAAGREIGFDREARVVRVPDFQVLPPADLPGGERYDDPARHLRLAELDERLTVTTDLDPAGVLSAGLQVKYELAVDAPPEHVAIDRDAGVFGFLAEGVYYLQAVVGRTLPGGTWDPVKLSSNVVVVAVTGLEARFVSPLMGDRGLAVEGAPFFRQVGIQLVRPTTEDPYRRAGVPVVFETLDGVLVFRPHVFAASTSEPQVTDSQGQVWLPIYASGWSGDETIVAYEQRPGRDPHRREIGRVTVETQEIRIAFPTGDPRGPGAGTDNEFCFSDESPGVLRIETRAAWEDGTPVGPCDSDPQSVACRLSWEIDAIGPPGGPPTLAWRRADPANPDRGLGGENWVTFTGLPPRYRDFGHRWVLLWYDGWLSVTEEGQGIEVFFPRDATNHGFACAVATAAETIDRGDSGPCTNAFYYGLQALAIGPPWLRPLYATVIAPARGETPAVYNWTSYRGTRNAILLSHRAYDVGSLGTHCPRVLSTWGLTTFLNTVRHEAEHVRQILSYNMVEGFFQAETGVVSTPEQSCPSVPCGWAFASHGVEVRPGQPYFNRFHDTNANGRYDASDTLLDGDHDLIPDIRDPNPTEAHTPSWEDEFEWVTIQAEGCSADELIGFDWACPGRNAARADPRFDGRPEDCR